MITHGEFSSNGQQIVTASEDNYAGVWNAANGKPLRFLKNLHTADLTDASFSPDGTRILTASYDGDAIVCDWQNNKKIATFSPHAGVVKHAQFSPDGRQVITATIDHIARLWDVETKELIAVFSAGAPIQQASFTSKGNPVFALSYNGASGPEAAFQTGVPSSTVTDDIEDVPHSTVPGYTWDIGVENKHKVADLQAIAEVLACGSSERPEETSGPEETSELVKKWHQLSSAYLSDFREESASDYHARCAIESEAAKQWFAAAWHLTRLLEDNQTNSEELLRRRSIAYSHLGEPELAIKDLDVALRTRPNDSALLNLHAQARLANGDLDAAAQDCESLIAHSPSAEAQLRLAAVRCQQKRWDEAKNQLEAIIAADPDNYAALRRLAVVALERKDLKSYRATCSKILDRFKDKPKFGSIAAWPCILASPSVNDISVVVDLAHKAVEQSPENYYCVNTLAAALYRAGNYPEALKELQHSRSLFEDSATARAAASRDDSFLQGTPEPRHGRPVDWVFSAMANFMSHKKSYAEWWLGKVEQSLELETMNRTGERRVATGMETNSERVLWNKMELQLLFEEAKALIAPAAASATAPQ
jgi:tetratricopeptide (TPR) repeat protein